MYKRNYYLNRIKPFIGKPVIKVIVGMRRVGKSVLMKQIITLLKENEIVESNIIYINKELMKFDFIKDYKDLHEYFMKESKGHAKNYLLIDEVQMIESWEKSINSILSENKTDIYVTGSNSSILASELSTLIAGRYIQLEVFPLTFKEFLQFRDTDKMDVSEEFNYFIRYGGLPAIHYFDFEDEIIYQYINSIYNTILLKEIIEKHKVRNVSLLENIYKYVFDNIGNIFTAKRIVDYLKSQKIKVSVQTVQNYLIYLQSAFTAFKVERYDLKGKRILELYEKYYIGDIGLRNSVFGYKKNDIGGLLENIVFLELKVRGYDVTIGKKKDYEIDFIAEKNKQIKYFQVSYLLQNKKTIEREIRPLLAIDDNYPKFVLSMDNFVQEDNKGIHFVNIIDFLLNENNY